jgi:hypothetical protein
MDLDFTAYVARKKSGVSGERGEGYAFEGDLKVLRALRKVRPLELAIAQTVKLSKAVVTGDLLGTAVKVGPTQFPRIHRIVERCAKTLGIAPPQVYIVPRMDSYNAYTFGTDDDAFIVIHALLAEQFSDDELEFVIGHECGHIQNNHVVYLTTLVRIQQVMQMSAGLLAPLLMPLQLALQSWARAAEITCDRAGLLCCKSPEAAVRSFARSPWARRKLFAEMNVERLPRAARRGARGHRARRASSPRLAPLPHQAHRGPADLHRQRALPAGPSAATPAAIAREELERKHLRAHQGSLNLERRPTHANARRDQARPRGRPLRELGELADKAGRPVAAGSGCSPTASRASRRSARCWWCSASSTTARPPS